MNFLGFFDWGADASPPADINIVAHPASRHPGWTAVIADGESVIVDADSEGLRLFTDRAHCKGAEVRITVPGCSREEKPVEVRASVLSCRRNPLPQFGRNTCELAFAPPDQRTIRPLLERCRPT